MRDPDLIGRGHDRRVQIVGQAVRLTIGRVEGVPFDKWRAWDVMPSIDDAERREYPGALSCWTLHAPGSHPFWPWTRITAVHLRPLDGMPDPVLHFPQATHEIGILAIDPEQCPNPDPFDRELKFLRPSNLVHQIGGVSDEMVVETVRLLVRAFCNGYLNPDEDFRQANKTAIDATLAHMREGKHLPS